MFVVFSIKDINSLSFSLILQAFNNFDLCSSSVQKLVDFGNIVVAVVALLLLSSSNSLLSATKPLMIVEGVLSSTPFPFCSLNFSSRAFTAYSGILDMQIKNMNYIAIL